MFQITLYDAIVLYSAILGVLAVGIWLYTEIRTRRSYRFLERQFLWRCGFCGYTYLDESSDAISQCPRCQSFNAPEDKHARDPLVVTAPRGRPEEAPTRVPDQRNPSHRKRPHQRRRGPRRRR